MLERILYFYCYLQSRKAWKIIKNIGGKKKIMRGENGGKQLFVILLALV